MFCLPPLTPFSSLGTSRACAYHKCGLTTCTKIRRSGGEYCSKHKCPRSGCARACKSGAEACKSHICRMKGCLSPCQNISNSTACYYHTCYIESCNEVRRWLRVGNFCDLHSCQWSETRCPEAMIEGSRYCEQHKCHSPNCKYPCVMARYRRVMYCDNCQCLGEEWGARCESSSEPGSRGCKHHKCFEAGCDNLRGYHGFSPYCATHKCPGPYCMSRVDPEGGSNCQHHRSYKAGCANLRESPNMYYTTHTYSNYSYERHVDPADGSRCREHIAQEWALAPQHNALSIRSYQQNREKQAYGVGYIDGLAHGVNLAAAEQAEIRRLVGQGLDFGSPGHAELRDGVRSMVDMIAKGGSRIGSSHGGQRIGYVTSDPSSEYDDE